MTKCVFFIKKNVNIELKFVTMRFSGENFPKFVEDIDEAKILNLPGLGSLLGADTRNKVKSCGQSILPLTTLCRNKQSRRNLLLDNESILKKG